MCKFSSKSGGVPFQPLGDLTWNDPMRILAIIEESQKTSINSYFAYAFLKCLTLRFKKI